MNTFSIRSCWSVSYGFIGFLILPFSCWLSPWMCKSIFHSAQSSGTSDAGVLICASRFSLLPIMAIVHPTEEMGAVAGQCEISSSQNKGSWQPPFHLLAWTWAESWGCWVLSLSKWTRECRLMHPQSRLDSAASQWSWWTICQDFSSCVYLGRQLEVLFPSPLRMVWFTFWGLSEWACSCW